MHDWMEFSQLSGPTPARPLAGQTILVVDDSRYACEALRLLSLRSGARTRRANSLRTARKHLQVYRPTVAIIDMGLPDGCGADLIADMSHAHPRVEVILASSGDAATRQAALSAGADGFLSKPIASLAVFQHAILSNLPSDAQPNGPWLINEPPVPPDPAVLQGDLKDLVTAIQVPNPGARVDYIAQFASSLAGDCGDQPLKAAAENLAKHRLADAPVGAELQNLATLLQDRLERCNAV